LAIFTDSAHLVFLERAKELDLQWERHLADLVKQQCASIGRFEETGTVLDGSSECAARVTEQLAFEKRIRQRTAVYRDEGTSRARRGVVDESRESLLADSALTDNQDRRIDGGDTRLTRSTPQGDDLLSVAGVAGA
jgi:hypothetical protein